MTLAIGPDIDAYGVYGYASSLADFAEFAALKGRSLSRADVQNIIDDNDWSRRDRSTIRVVVEVPEGAADLAKQAFVVLKERVTVLGDNYPFLVSDERLSLRDDVELEQSAYISLLSHSMLHAWKMQSNPNPEFVLEDVAVRAMQGIGLPSFAMGTASTPGFVENFKQVCKYFDIDGMENPAPRPSRAKDVGVDTISGVVWRDRRVLGQWLFIGQVTLQTSGSWKKKMAEPSASVWAKFFDERIKPQVFLVVPYHVESPIAEYLMEHRRGVLIDRLRLTVTKGPNTQDEVALIKQLLALELDL